MATEPLPENARLANTPPPQDSRRLEVSLMAGCVVLAGVFLVGCLGIFGTVYRADIPLLNDYFPGATPTATGLPQLLAHRPPAGVPVLEDDFSTNRNNWSSRYLLEKVDVRDGRMFLEGYDTDSISIAICFCKAPMDQPVQDTYYLQADLATDNPTRADYGLVFGLTEKGTFYEYTIDPPLGKYYLRKALDDSWVNLYSGASSAIRPYPAANTLSVFYDRGAIELYVNGKQVATYNDKTPIYRGQIGIITGGVDFKVVVDNLFAYHK